MDQHIEELNLGEPTTPRPAASVILLRRGGRHSSAGLQLLLCKRTPKARFMAGVWVFPGGSINDDVSDDAAHRATALRELREEVSIELAGPEALVPFSRWITPMEVKTRFDTHFYLALASPHMQPQADGEEIVGTAWLAPSEALERHTAGDLLLVFPTIKQLEALGCFSSPEEAIADARSRTIEPILPRVITEGNQPRIVLPGDPGY